VVPEKQGLKLSDEARQKFEDTQGISGGSRKTRIETLGPHHADGQVW